MSQQHFSAWWLVCRCAAYLDDVVVFSDTWEAHVPCLRAVFDRLVEANLTKCEFAKATVTYLGKVVGQGVVRPVQAKVEAISKYPAPTSKKELMQFLGLVGYYCSFCHNFSIAVAPLTNLLRKNTPFILVSLLSSDFQWCEETDFFCSCPYSSSV